jgi:hypothetical protein
MERNTSFWHPPPPNEPDPRREPDLRSRWVVAAGIVAAVAVVVVAILPGPTLPEQAFYGVAAQIFPVLLVALVVEARMDDFWRERPRSVRWPLFATLGLGELFALVAASGTLAATPAMYDKWAGRNFLWGTLFGRADVDRVRKAGVFVAWNPQWSLVVATVVGIALVWGFLGVLAVATVGDRGVSAPKGERQAGEESL